MRASGPGPATAVVLSSAAIENVRPLAMAGIPATLVVARDDPARLSRAVRGARSWDWATVPEGTAARRLLAGLLDLAATTTPRPVLMPCGEESLLFCSRRRAELDPAYHQALPDPDTVEDLVDKARFSRLAAELDLPVPATRVLLDGPARCPGPDDLPFPLLLKPTIRGPGWRSVAPDEGKALLVRSAEELQTLWPHLCALGVPLVAQEHLDGPESMIESYHVAVGRGGEVLGEFTGVKIRTLPARYGHTTSLRVGHEPEVARLGRDLTRRLDLRGVAKLDFKRDARGRLRLLEVNPRFSLWHHAGARAGVNLPALIHADLTGAPRPAARRARAVTWCHPTDLVAARGAGVGPGRWLGEAARADAIAFWAWNDPLPLAAALARRTLPVLRRGRPTDAAWRAERRRGRRSRCA